jgi:hypothetical protein
MGVSDSRLIVERREGCTHLAPLGIVLSRVKDLRRGRINQSTRLESAKNGVRPLRIDARRDALPRSTSERHARRSST